MRNTVELEIESKKHSLVNKKMERKNVKLEESK